MNRWSLANQNAIQVLVGGRSYKIVTYLVEEHARSFLGLPYLLLLASLLFSQQVSTRLLTASLT